MPCEDCERLKSERDEARQNLNRAMKGETWSWQDDGEDHPESLACPVLVQPNVIRRWASAERLIEEMREGLADMIKRAQGAKQRVGSKPRKALFTAEEGYDAGLVDFADEAEALIKKAGGETK